MNEQEQQENINKIKFSQALYEAHNLFLTKQPALARDKYNEALSLTADPVK